MVLFLEGVVVGISIAGLVTILIGPGRRVRAESGMDDEVETRLLLGVDPEPTSQHPVVESGHRQFDTSQLQALRQLGRGRAPRGAR